MSPKKPSKNDGAAKPRLILLDGHGIIHGAYNAFRQPLTMRKTGEVYRAPAKGGTGLANASTI